VSDEIPMSEQMQAGVVGDLASAAQGMRSVLDANEQLPAGRPPRNPRPGVDIDLDRAVTLWLEIGDGLCRYGEMRGLDVSPVERMRTHA
jgi:hypothetical protein